MTPPLQSPSWRRLALVAALASGICGIADNARAAEGASSPPEVARNETEQLLADALELQVTESGPQHLWQVRVTNKSQRHIRLGTDPRLLWFTASVPGRKKQAKCRIPEGMRPASIARRTKRLAPSEHLQFSIDPRFYCFDKGDQSVLVPGAQILPHFGWPETTKTRWRKGRRVTVRTEQEPPYLARLATAPGPLVHQHKRAHVPSSHRSERQEKRQKDPAMAHEEDEDPAMTAAETQSGLKGLTGPPIALSTAYAEWSRTRLPPPTSEGPGLHLEVTHGSDSKTASGARVTIRITNRGTRTERLFLRREHLNFILLGPDGLLTCPAADEDRAPDAAGFTRLKPGQHTTLVSRLLEFCNADALDRAGFYLLAAEVDLDNNGSEVGIQAYTGKLFSTQLRPLRIRSGALPFSYEAPMSLRQARRALRKSQFGLGAPPLVGRFRPPPGGETSPPAPAQPTRK